MTGAGVFGPGFGGLDRRGQVERAARELESVVLTQLLSTMRETVPDGGLLDKSATEDMFRSLLDGELARSASERSPFGLARALTEQLAKEVQPAPGPADESVEPESPGPGGRSWRI